LAELQEVLSRTWRRLPQADSDAAAGGVVPWDLGRAESGACEAQIDM
jgi:hypothetical protein